MLSAVINSSQVEMFPYFPAFDEANQSLDYIEGSSDFFLRLRGGEYRTNLIVGELGHVMQAASCGAFRTPLGDHVSRVVGVSAQKQMVRIDTGPRIAVMANAFPRGNRTKPGFPRNAMRKSHFPVDRKRGVSGLVVGGSTDQTPCSRVPGRVMVKPLLSRPRHWRLKFSHVTAPRGWTNYRSEMGG